MAVLGGPGLFDVLGLGQKFRPQPFGRGLQVAAVVDPLAGALGQRVFVGPVPRGSGRVEADKGQAEFAAAQRGLLDVSHRVLAALDLVRFLKPQHTDVAERQLDGLDLLRVVQAAEQNALPGGQVGALQRALGTLEFACQPQLVDGPQDLRVHAVPQRVGHLAADQRVAVRVTEQLQDHLHAHIGAFQAGTSTFFDCLIDEALVDLPVGFVKRRADHVL